MAMARPMAVAADNAGNYHSARSMYLEGIQMLINAADITRDEAQRRTLREHVDVYLKRLETLKKLMDAQPVQAAESQVDGFFRSGEFCFEQALCEEEKGASGDSKAALDYYTAAAEWYLKCVSPVSKHTAAAQARATLVLDRAEALKVQIRETESLVASFSGLSVRSSAVGVGAGAGAGAGAGRGGGGGGGGGSGALTEEEKLVLRNTSFVNGKLFVPFLHYDLQEQFYSKTPFTDPDGVLGLSSKQRSRFGGWKRPSSFLSSPTMIDMVSAFSIKQDLVTDCSFVASLCISAAYERRFKKQLITSIIYPQDRAGRPVYNPSGKYMVKLHVNGVARKIVVDDQLPMDVSGRLLCSYSTNPNELWVSIIEKAYLKVHGGYDFPGSNSGIDLYALTGWIPESFRTRSAEFDPARTWERLESGSRHGDVLITISTGPMTEDEEERFGLVETHAYAVLDVREISGLKLLQVKNPWSHKRWRGAFSVEDRVNWTPALREALMFDQTTAMQYDNGIFWIDYDSVLKHFHSIFFNWNPELFSYRQVAHGCWPLAAPGPRNDRYTVGDNPQYRLEIRVPPATPPTKTSAVWLLLTRHVLDKELEDDAAPSSTSTASVTGEGDDDTGAAATKDYLALHVFRTSKLSEGGERVYYYSDAWMTGTYMNNPHVLVRFDVPPGEHVFTLVVSQYMRWRDVYYTLQALCMAPIKLAPVPERFPRKLQTASAWTAETSGGNSSALTFFNNPQFTVQVDVETDLFVAVKAPQRLAVNVRVYSSDGERLYGAGVKVLASSGDYRCGFSYCVVRGVAAGKYTILASCFEAAALGQFTVVVGASRSPIRLAPCTAASDGLTSKVQVAGEWLESTGTAAGCVNHGNYDKNPKLLLTVPRECSMALALHGGVSSTPHMNLSVFQCPSTGELPSRFSVSRAFKTTNGGVYENSISGLAITKSTMPAGSYILIPSTFDPQPGVFTVTCYSSFPVTISTL